MENKRLKEAKENNIPWKKWGPYLSERQWGTVREDYSTHGDAWNYFPHDHARSRAYKSGEDGMAGFSDEKARLCFALAMWNGKDPILKERLFGLTGQEGNHGEDVKEYYYYLDSTPTHSYMKWLYKYPQQAYPYLDIINNNRRSRLESEYELIDTGIFNLDKYFDVVVEYAKSTPEDILIKVTVFNRADEDATIHLLPTLWFRNTWSWTPGSEKPGLEKLKGKKGMGAISAKHPDLGERWLYVEGDAPLLFTENETNNKRIYGTENATQYVKDSINDYVVHGITSAVNPEGTGTKAASYSVINVKAGGSSVIRLRLSDSPLKKIKDPFTDFDEIFDLRLKETDEFYKDIIPAKSTPDEGLVMRQALAGMLWSKQYFLYEVDKWIREHGGNPFTGENGPSRNSEWGHMTNDNIISMPDKWEYPWYAAWDLAFHTVALAVVDIDFAKNQLRLMLGPKYIHPSGQIPAYEWNFSDVNPPVMAWAALYLYRMEKAITGKGDLTFVKVCFGKLTANFTWWLNRKDRFGKNLFEGGFLGLDNIGVFDRSKPLPTGGYLEQADGTAWMTFFSQNMLEMAMEISAYDPAYDEMAAKFMDHFLWISRALSNIGHDGLWDEEDGFFYDVLRLPDGSSKRLKVRSIVGLLPLCASTVIEPFEREMAPDMMKLFEERKKRTPELLTNFFSGRGYADRGIMAPFNPERLRRMLSYMLDENEFLGPHGIRALSKFHDENPYIFNVNGEEFRVNYLPGDSDSSMFGGNSNWRGPVWMPINFMLVRALLHLYLYYGDSFKVECPTGSGKEMNLCEVAKEISDRLVSAFLRDSDGNRPIYGYNDKFQNDPYWRDLLIFPEYFHGDTGAGVGANHQTGWTGLVAPLIKLFADLDPEEALARGKNAAFIKKNETVKIKEEIQANKN